MREEKIWFWKVYKDPIWGTYTSRARMTEAEARATYKQAERIERVEQSLMVIQVAETQQELAQRLPGGIPRR